jgi:uncharacterized protein
MANKFVWYDVMTTDVEAAKTFYSSVIGWRCEDSGQTGQPYTLCYAGDVQVGGIFAIPEHAKGMPPVWMGYIGVSDVDAYALKITQAGGTVWREPADIPGVGRFAVVADPNGAGFIIFKGNMDAGPAPAPFMATGHVGWNELHCGNLEQDWAFYSGLFGWQKGFAHDMGPEWGLYQTFGETSAPPGMGGVMKKMASSPMPHWTYYFSVGDILAGAQRVKDNGGTVVMEPHEVPGGTWIAPCIDPQGAHFALIGNKVN